MKKLSPYNFQQPINEIHDFFGRDNIVSKIYSRIGADRPQSVSIVGDYKMGKTSLLSYLVEREVQKQFLDNHQKYIFLFISIRDSHSDTFMEFFPELCNTIADKTDTEFTFTSIAESYTWFKHVVETLTQRAENLIIFMDDFNIITQNSDFPLEFFSFLRSLANNFNVAYVTSSYQDLQKLCASKDIEESPFFNIFTNITLRVFEPDTVTALLSEKGFNSIMDSQDQINLIRKYTGNFPYLVQLSGDILFKMKGDSQSLVEIEKFGAIFSKKSEDFFKSLWDNLQEDYKMLLESIVSRQQIPESQQYMIKILLRKNYIFESNGRNVLFSPTFTRFVVRERNIQTSSLIAVFIKKVVKFFRFKQGNSRL